MMRDRALKRLTYAVAFALCGSLTVLMGCELPTINLNGTYRGDTPPYASEVQLDIFTIFPFASFTGAIQFCIKGCVNTPGLKVAGTITAENKAVFSFEGAPEGGMYFQDGTWDMVVQGEDTDGDEIADRMVIETANRNGEPSWFEGLVLDRSN